MAEGPSALRTQVSNLRSKADLEAVFEHADQNDTPGVVGSVIIRVPLAADCQRTRSGPPGAGCLPHAPDTPGEGGG